MPPPGHPVYLAPSQLLFRSDRGRTDHQNRGADCLESREPNPGAAVDITGFADQTGSAAANEELAKERAQTVRGTLVAAGVPEARTTLAPPSSVTGGRNDREARRVAIRLKST